MRNRLFRSKVKNIWKQDAVAFLLKCNVYFPTILVTSIKKSVQRCDRLPDKPLIKLEEFSHLQHSFKIEELVHNDQSNFRPLRFVSFLTREYSKRNEAVIADGSNFANEYSLLRSFADSFYPSAVNFCCVIS